MGKAILPRGFGSAVSFSTDGSRLAVLWRREPFFEHPSELYVWDATSGKEVARLVALAAGQSIGRFALNADGSRFVGLTWPAMGSPLDGPSTLVIWETATGQVFVNRPSENGDWPAFSPDGRRIVLVEASPLGTEDRVTILDAATGRPTVSRKVRKGILSRADRIVFSRDGRCLAIYSLLEQATVTIWDTDALINQEAAEPVAALVGHGNVITRVEFGPDGRRVLTSGGDAASSGTPRRGGNS